MHSPTWKPGSLNPFILLLLSCLFPLESAAQNRSFPQEPPPQAPITSTNKSSTSQNNRTSPAAFKTNKSPFGRGFYRPKPNNNIAAQLEKQEFLAAHNKIRFVHGEPPFTWDQTLANYAKKYFFGQRLGDCKLVHSSGPYGENLFWGTGTQWKPSDAVRFWADEIKFYNREVNSCQSGQMCGHYTQMVWRDSLRLGCYKGTCRNGDTYIVCSYDPPGNYVGEKPFDSHI